MENQDAQPAPRLFHETSRGRIFLGDALDVLRATEDASIDLIMTGPPFGLVRKKEYGNVEADQYLAWFKMALSRRF